MGKINSKRTNDIISLMINGKTFLILIVLFAVISIASPYFLKVNNLMNIVRQNAAAGILAVGFTLVVSSGNLDLSVGRMVGLLGVITSLLSKVPGMPFTVVVITALVMGAACGALNGLVGTKLHIPMFITTVAMQGVFQGANYLISGSSTINQIPKAYTFIGQHSLFGFLPIPVIILVVVVVIGYFILNKTIIGRYVLAVGGNRQAAMVSGINSDRVIITVYIIMGLCASIAALVLTGRAASAQPDAGSGMELDCIAAVIIGGTTLGGGTGKMLGSLIGCIIIGLISNGLNLLGVDTNWQLVSKGVLIILAVWLDYQTGMISNRLRNRVSKKA